MSKAKPIIVLIGPTASGKTQLAAHLAYNLNSAVFSADSRQVYKHLNIGTGKDYHAYVINNKKIPYYLIDLVEPYQEFDLTTYLTESIKLLKTFTKIPVLSGGTGMYIQALLQKYKFAFVPVNPNLREKLNSFSMVNLNEYFSTLPKNAYTTFADISTKKRLIRAIEIGEFFANNAHYKLPEMPSFNPLIFGLNPPLQERRYNIEKRLKERLDKGLIEEAENLLKMGITHQKLMYFGLEYKFLSLYLQNKLNKNELIVQLTIAIQQYAKRQMTYFRKMEKDGLAINWINHDLNFNQKVDFCMQLIQQKWSI
jgi:tRNA dimethylallyltransferase